MSTRETILAAFQTTLAALASGRVYRERKEQLPALPAIVISPADESAEERMLGVMDAELGVIVDFYLRGDTPSQTADALLLAAQAALCADLSLGLGSDVQIQPRRTVRWDQDAFDEAKISVTYTVFYRTAFGSM